MGSLITIPIAFGPVQGKLLWKWRLIPNPISQPEPKPRLCREGLPAIDAGRGVVAAAEAAALVKLTNRLKREDPRNSRPCPSPKS